MNKKELIEDLKKKNIYIDESCLSSISDGLEISDYKIKDEDGNPKLIIYSKSMEIPLPWSK